MQVFDLIIKLLFINFLGNYNINNLIGYKENKLQIDKYIKFLSKLEINKIINMNYLGMDKKILLNLKFKKTILNKENSLLCLINLENNMKSSFYLTKAELEQNKITKSINSGFYSYVLIITLNKTQFKIIDEDYKYKFNSYEILEFKALYNNQTIITEKLIYTYKPIFAYFISFVISFITNIILWMFKISNILLKNDIKYNLLFIMFYLYFLIINLKNINNYHNILLFNYFVYLFNWGLIIYLHLKNKFSNYLSIISLSLAILSGFLSHNIILLSVAIILIRFEYIYLKEFFNINDILSFIIVFIINNLIFCTIPFYFVSYWLFKFVFIMNFMIFIINILAYIFKPLLKNINVI